VVNRVDGNHPPPEVWDLIELVLGDQDAQASAALKIQAMHRGKASRKGGAPPDKKELDPDFDLIMNEDLASNIYPAALMEAARAADRTSLCAKFCTPATWEQYKDTVSSGPAKWTMARAINSGVSYPHSFVGCHAGDARRGPCCHCASPRSLFVWKIPTGGSWLSLVIKVRPPRRRRRVVRRLRGLLLPGRPGLPQGSHGRRSHFHAHPMYIL
jgi:hypothetical protein